MKNEAIQKYEDNKEEIARLEALESEIDEAFKKMKAEYESNKEELFNTLKYLRRQNHKIAETIYTFSLGEIIEETKNIAKSYGYSDPIVTARVCATVWNSGKSRSIAKSVEECRKWLEDLDNVCYLQDAAIRLNIKNSSFDKTKEYWFSFRKKLDFDMPMCDGSTLIDNLHSQVDYDDIQCCYNTKLFLTESAYKNLPIVIDPTNYFTASVDAFNNEFITEVFTSLITKRQKDIEKDENNR